MIKWEYKKIPVYHKAMDVDMANILGAQGWEMVGPVAHSIWFKRKVVYTQEENTNVSTN